MVEDINMLLNTGDIPNLYGMDEKVEILDKMQTAVREAVSDVCIDNIRGHGGRHQDAANPLKDFRNYP